MANATYAGERNIAAHLAWLAKVERNMKRDAPLLEQYLKSIKGGRAMKEVKHYICEICGTEYNEKLKASKCEKNHKKPLKIGSCKYNAMNSDNTGLPSSIMVEFDDGQSVKFSRF